MTELNVSCFSVPQQQHTMNLSKNDLWELKREKARLDDLRARGIKEGTDKWHDVDNALNLCCPCMMKKK